MKLKYLPVLIAVAAGAVSAEAIAKKCKMTVPGARGALRSLRQAGFVGGDNVEASITKAGERTLAAAQNGTQDAKTPTGRSHKRNTKMAKAITLFDRHIGQGRQAVLAKFQEKLDMTPGAASTYFQNIRVEKGLTSAGAAA